MEKNLFRILSFFLLIAVAASALAACHAPEAAGPDDTITFTDVLGRSATEQKQPERTAALIGSFADMWILSGGSICAAAEDAWEDFGLELPDAVYIGGAHSPNPELLLAADPDFVIASASTASNVALMDVLDAAGIPVAYFDIDNFEDYLWTLGILTDITGRKDLYEQNGTALAAQIETVKRDFADSSLPAQQRTVLLLRAASGFVKAKNSEGTILGEMLADLGCINIADSDASVLETLNVESVIRQNPYHIFVVTMGADPEKAIDQLNRMMQENPAWGTLDAVQEGRLHLMERKLFHNKPNVRWAESYEKLCDILLQQ